MAQDHDRTRRLSALDAIPAGCDRETWVRAAMAAKASGLEFSDFLAWSEQAGNFKSEQDCQSVWKSIKPDGGVGPGTLFALAKDAGWRDDSGVKPPDRDQRAKVRDKAAKPSQEQKHKPTEIWATCAPATAAHEYIKRKLGLHGDARVYSGPLKISGRSCDGALVLPVSTLSGDIATLQFVLTGDCRKLFLPGVGLPPDGCLIVGGPLTDAQRAYLVEGIGQAWSAHQATRAPAVVTFGAARMATVAKAVRAAVPDAELVLVADRGKEPQCAEIASGIQRCAWVEMPQDRPANFDLNDHHKEVRNLRAVADLLAQTKKPPQRFPILSAAELAALPALRWRIKWVLPEFGLVVVFGPSGSGKTFLVLDMAARMAAATSWFGYAVLPCPVVYIGLEGAAGLSQRVKAYRTKHGDEAGRGLHFITASLDLLSGGDVTDLIAAIQGTGARAVFLDTLNAAAPGADENSSQDMGRIISAAKTIQALIGGLVVLVHHSGKDVSRGLRGHSSLYAAMDAALEVSRNDARREWKLSKAKDGVDGRSHPFHLAVVPLGSDDDGDAITSCVIEPIDAPTDSFRRVLPPKGGHQKIVWDGVGEMLRGVGLLNNETAPADLPTGRPAVPLDEVVERLRDRLPCEPKRQTERTRQAISGLVSQGLLTLREGFLWVT